MEPTTLTQFYGPATGPLGLPCTDEQAFAQETLLKQLPRGEDYRLRRVAVLDKATPLELLVGERADVAVISNEELDRDGDIVLAAGMDDSQFALNPMVTLNHNYWMPPVARSEWRRLEKRDGKPAILAKTCYPVRPPTWPASQDWPSDECFGLVQSGLLVGKSIGFFPKKFRKPSEEEIKRNPGLAKCRRIIEEWLLLEYAVTHLPVNPYAVTEAVSKGFREALGLNQPAAVPPPPAPPALPAVIPHTPLAEIEKALARALAVDAQKLSDQAVQEALARRRGHV